jgi:hypothetical protein
MTQPEPAAYPCPACHAPATLATGCSGCGRGPDPEAAEVIRLGGTIEQLTTEVERARQEYAGAAERLRAAQWQRNELAARVAARTAAEQASAAARVAARTSAGPALSGVIPAGPAPDGIVPVPPARPETSGRTAQNVLFVLGGLLLASAAIVFTAVAWARFGVAGRAAILAGTTVLTLAVPPVALRRRLSGTAETFAALGLLLVLLDGYAAWYVDLAGVQALDAGRYAGLVCAITAAVALGYGLGTGLAGPRFVALVVAQPVLPLLILGAGQGNAGWAAVFAVVAAADVAVVYLAGRWSGAGLPLSVVAWLFAGAALFVASLAAFGALVSADDVPAAIRTGLVLILIASVLVAAAIAGPLAELRHVAAGAAAIAVVLAAARITIAGRPDLSYPLVAAELIALAAVVRALPVRVRVGPRIGLLLTAGVLSLYAVARALLAALMTVVAAFPVWHADLQPTAGWSDWRSVAAIVALGLTVAVLLPRTAAVDVALGTAVVLAFALPGLAGLPWWSSSLVDVLLVAVLAVTAVTVRSVPRTVVYGCAAALFAIHAVAAGLARPVSTAAVLAALVVVATAVAALGRRPQTADEQTAGEQTAPDQRRPARDAGLAVGAVAAGTALLALPGLAASVVATAGAVPATVRAFAAVGLLLAVGALVALRRWWPEYTWSGALAVLLGGVGLTVAGIAAAGAPFGVYAALAVLCDVAAVLVVTPALRERAWARPAVAVLLTLPAGPALASVAPAVWAVLAGPYAWLDKVWSGAPAGVGVAVDAPTDAYAFAPAATALALLTVALLAAARVWRPAAVWSAVPATPAVLTCAAALRAPWPTIAALSLAIGVGAGLAGALRRQSPALAAVAAVATGAGLAGALPTRAATLTALAVVLIAAALCGLAGRTLAARTAGWLVAAAGAAGLALAAGLAAEVTLRWASLWVLGAAALTLATAALLRPRAEAVVVEGAAHVTALVALLLTLPAIRHTATVCILWGLALGLRALLPGEPAVARRVRVVAGAGSELVAYWLLLVASDVAVLEAYTLPAAGVALLAGWLAARTRPQLHSWSAYGPALLAGFGPSAVTLLGSAGEPARRLTVGVAAVIVVVAGSIRRRQAPVVVGGSVLALVALHEVALVWDLLPRWIPLAVAGLLLVGLAMTYERRRRDLARLREAVGRLR